MDGFRIPDVIGEAVGFKRLNVLEPTAPYSRLASSYGHGSEVENIWPTNQWYIAKCPSGCTDVPNEGHTCGIYSTNSLDRLLAETHYAKWDTATGPVVVQIGMSGKVIPGQLGWKAERARITVIYVPLSRHELGQKLSRLYRAELVCSDAWCKTSARNLRV
jgi:hypothetical protein